MNKRTIWAASLIIVALVVSVSAYSLLDKGGSGPLIVYSADSYSQETSYLLQHFHNSSGAQVAPVKSGGSLTDARNIGGGSPSDVFISVSLASYQQSYLKSRYSGWAVAFAADQMVLAYSNATLQNASGKQVIQLFSNATRSNLTADYSQAFASLTSGSVKVGIADANSDPAGYRGWLVLEMAGKLYNSNSSYFVNRMTSNGGNVSASDAASLVAPLDYGNIQFLFIYRSAAQIKGLHYVQLPGKINLGDVAEAQYYSSFSYRLDSGNVTAAPIYLYISTLANSSSHAEGFVEFVLNNTELLSGFGLSPVKPELLYGSGSLPGGISQLLTSGNLTRAGGL